MAKHYGRRLKDITWSVLNKFWKVFQWRASGVYLLQYEVLLGLEKERDCSWSDALHDFMNKIATLVA